MDNPLAYKIIHIFRRILLLKDLIVDKHGPIEFSIVACDGSSVVGLELDNGTVLWEDFPGALFSCAAGFPEFGIAFPGVEGS
jgi:hypothetical protein